MIRPLFVISIAALALTACGGDPAPAAQDDDNRRAEGEVQGGTISDAMIPLDTLTSQSPPMKRRPSSGDDTDGEAETGEATAEPGEEAATAPAETAAPAAAPTPEETPAPPQ